MVEIVARARARAKARSAALSPFRAAQHALASVPTGKGRSRKLVVPRWDAGGRPSRLLPAPSLYLVWTPALAVDALKRVTSWVRMSSAQSRRTRYSGRYKGQHVNRDWVPYAEQLQISQKPPLWGGFGQCHVTPCRTCGLDTGMLIWESAWKCKRCYSQSPERVEQALYLQASAYQFGLLIGANGCNLKILRANLLRAINRRMGRPKPLGDRALVLFTALPLLFEVNPNWLSQRARSLIYYRPRSLPPADVSRGPLWKAVTPHMPQAFVDTILHPEVYRHRYEQWLGTRWVGIERSYR